MVQAMLDTVAPSVNRAPDRIASATGLPQQAAGSR
jgi:hypothetical protein